jgi:hypothetical protein
MGLGHVTRDVVVVQALRQLVPDVQVTWLCISRHIEQCYRGKENGACEFLMDVSSFVAKENEGDLCVCK